jgi:glycerol-3-phosphate dehydrogenase
VLALAGARPELAAPIVPGQPDLLAEAALAARVEQARSVADVLLRRTRLGILAAPALRTAEAVRPVAAALGAELGWGEERIDTEAERWIVELASEGIDPAGAVSSPR